MVQGDIIHPQSLLLGQMLFCVKGVKLHEQKMARAVPHFRNTYRAF